MNQKRRPKRKKMCDGKQSYPDENTAYDAARALSYKYRSLLTHYRCPYCGAYHVGRGKRTD